VDKKYFAELIEKHSDTLYRCAVSYCNNKQDAEDIVQEVFVKCMKKNPSFTDDSHEKAWLIRATINLCKDLQKTYWKRNVSELTEDIVDDSEDNKNLYYLISQLPLKYRIVIQLHYQEGYKIKEIAEILHKKESTVGNQLARGKALLKKMYEEGM